jgi:chromosome segregation ATPase
LKNENQSLIEEIKRFANENERLNIIKTQFEQNSTFFKSKTRSHELELNDLAENYRNAVQENDRLKKNLQMFVDENRAAAQHIKMIESTLVNYQQNAKNVIKEKDNLVNQIEQLQKYNSKLSDELTRAKAQVDTFSAMQKSYKQNSRMDGDINKSNENYINTLNKQIAKLQNEKNVLQDKIIQMKNNNHNVNDNNMASNNNNSVNNTLSNNNNILSSSDLNVNQNKTSENPVFY